MNIKNNKFVFSERLLNLRRHLKWTQGKLALESKINEHTISRWVKKKFEPNNESIRKISEATGCNPRYLTGEESTMFLVNSLGVTKSPEKSRRIYSRTSDQESPTGDMLAHFSNKKSARECIDRLLEIDRINPDRLKRVETFLHGILEGIRPEKKTENNS